MGAADRAVAAGRFAAVWAVRHQPFDTKQCRQVIADRQAHAVIPPRKNAKPWKDTKSSSLERNELLRTVKRFSRTLWKKWSGYHRRSLVETKMHCIKLLGDKLSARNFQSQVNEIHARVAVLNRFTELGRPHTQVYLKFGSSRVAQSFKPLCNKATVIFKRFNAAPIDETPQLKRAARSY